MEMEKQFIEMDVDPATLICANPYDVNPIMAEKSVRPATLNVDVPLKDESSAIPPPHWDMSYGGEFYKPQKNWGTVKLEMETFGDLSSFVLPKPMSINSVDELNTPIFDKDAFDFNVNVFPKDSQSDTRIKLECDATYGNCIITDNHQFKDSPLNRGKVHQNGNIHSELSNMILQNHDINLFPPHSSNNGSVYSCKLSPTFETQNSTVFNVDDNSALSVNRQFSDISSTNEMFQTISSGLETPEDSNSSNCQESHGRPSHLSLDLNLKPAYDLNLTTPNIVDEVARLETGSFDDLLRMVEEEDMAIINPEDLFSTPNSIPSIIIPEVNENLSIPQKRPRKKRTYSDDDEDYVPPTKKNVIHRKKIIKEDSDSEVDSDVDIDVKPKTKTRGRPPKRTESISSDCSKDSDASKYRELRDKNNEASRKSRLKRKIKELEIEKESDELRNKNIKLKAQVEELEKMVTNFRDNLFKIMIRK